MYSMGGQKILFDFLGDVPEGCIAECGRMSVCVLYSTLGCSDSELCWENTVEDAGVEMDAELKY
jgi:hypothetical protein